jgi:hypothetical protein
VGPAVTFQRAQGPWVDLHQTQEPIYKSAQNMEIPGLFSSGKSHRLGPRCCGLAVRLGPLWTNGWCGHLEQRCFIGARHTGARCHRCSSAVAKEEEQDEVVPKEWSPEHEQ